MTQTVLLGEICRQITDGAHWSPKSTETGYPMASVKDMLDYKINLESCRKISEEDYHNLVKSGCRPKKDDILIAKDGSYLKQMFVSDGKDDVVLLSSIAILRPNLEIIDPRYLVYCIRNQRDNGDLSQYVSGAAIPRIILKNFARMPIKLPDLGAQRKIADILGMIDEKIELNRKMNETLEQMGQALFRHYFIDNPEAEKWEEVKIGELVNIKGGGTPSTKNIDFWNGDIAWTSPRDLTGKNDAYLLDTGKKITQTGLAKISSGLLPSETLLLSSRAPIGYVALAGLPLAINQGYIAFQPGAYLSNYYMYFWLYQNMERIKNAANGSTFMEISKSAFRNITTVKPDEKSLLEFDSKVEGIFEAMRNNQEQIQNLATLRDTLLPGLINGKVKI